MIEQNYNLNTIPSASPVPIVHVSQYDKGSRTLKFKLFEGSGEYSMASVNGAKINGKKPDGSEFSYNMTIAGNVVSVDVTEQMTAVAGRVVSEIVLSGANGAVLGTANFIIEVEESPMDEGVISDTDVPVIVDFVVGGTVGQFFRRTATGGEWVDYIPSGASWGTITGNLADQTDLNDALAATKEAGVPAGGTAGQILAKKSATSYDTEWVCPFPIGYGGFFLTDPNSIYSGTKWEQKKDVFILASGTAYPAGSTGGEAEHVLTVAEIARHDHVQSVEIPNGIAVQVEKGSDGTGPFNGTPVVQPGTWITEGRAVGTKYEGGSQPHNNMPPYYSMPFWVRTA